MSEEGKNEALDEELDFTKPNFTFIPKDSHGWRQHGPYLICKTCELEHAVWIGMERIMVGIDEQGKPILKPRT